MQLIFVALGSRTALQVAHVAAFISHHERALKLARTGFIDAEIGAQFHRAANTLGDVAERPVGEDRAIEGSVKVVGLGNDSAQIFFYELRVFLDGLAHGAEDDALFGQGLFEGCRHGDRIHHHIHGHSGQALLLV